MRLSKLEIYGFKSFAKRTQIVFPQNVTGIVGPNGCGKSNIADAVRWVLGEQSPKQLRGNAMTDVIFNGTQQRKPMNYCEVTLTFDNTDGELETEYTEVAVSRRVFRSGDSEYMLNGSACRLKDVIDLFRDTGLGREGYSIIGQGRMDEILSNRSEDRRAVFEEAAGISRFRARKEEAERRLLRSDENLNRVRDLLEELQGMLGPMAAQAELAKEYLALSETLRELDVTLYLRKFDRLKKRTATVEDALRAVAEEIQSATGQLKALSDGREHKEADLEALQQALSDAHQTALLLKKEELHLAQEQRQAVSSRAEAARETVERLDSEREAAEARRRMIEATADESKSGEAEGERLRAEAEAQLAQRRAENESAAQAADGLEEELNRHKSAIIEMMNRVQEQKTTHARQSAMLSQMEKRRAELEGSLAGDTQKETALQTAYETARQNLQRETQLLREREEAYQSLEGSAQRLQAEAGAQKAAAAKLAEQARALELRVETLQELAEGYEGYQVAVKEALSFAKARGLSGVHDVVAKLISVPGAYETAFDMALGAAMQHIVTDTEHTAKTIIEHLRQNRLGRATFLPISAMKGRTLSAGERRVLSMKGCLGVASELCEYPEQYRGVIENLLGRTVLAEDLDSGVQIMRVGAHAFRLVTLQGDVMHAGGSMTGGSTQQRSQNLLGRDRMIRDQKQALENTAAALEQAMTRADALTREQEETQQKLESARYELQQQEIAVVRDTERQASAKAELDNHLLQLTDVREAVAQLDEDIEEIQADLRRATNLTDEDAPDEAAMAEKTTELSAALNKARRERERTQEALTAALLSLQQAEHQCDRVRRDFSRLETERETCLKDLTALARRKEQAEAVIEATAAELALAGERIALAEAAAAQAGEGVTQAEAARTEAQKTLRELQTEIEAVRMQLDKAVEREHRQEMSMERARAELEQLDQRLWDTYSLSYAGAQAAYDEYLLVKQEAGGDENFDEKAAETQAEEIRARIKAMGHVNTGAIDEYAQLNERITEQAVQQDDILKAKQDLEGLIVGLEKEMRKVFTEQFQLLQEYFAVSFKRLFGGGHAELKLETPKEPAALRRGGDRASAGQEAADALSLFSNGERALTAIALLFSMLNAAALALLYSGRGGGCAGRSERRQLRRLSARDGRAYAVYRDHPPQGHHGAVRFAVRRGDGRARRERSGEREPEGLSIGASMANVMANYFPGCGRGFPKAAAISTPWWAIRRWRMRTIWTACWTR